MYLTLFVIVAGCCNGDDDGSLTISSTEANRSKM